MPGLTVMMAARDAEQTIARAAASTLRAMPRDSELVVWDDASSDGTVAEVSRLGDSRVRVISSPRALGSGAGRQAILDATDSAYVATMDADDVCLPWRFTIQIPMVRSGADAAFASFVRFGPERLRLRPSAPLRYSASDAPRALMFHSVFSHPTLVARREAIADVGGYSDLRVAQDYELWLRLAAAGHRLAKAATPVVGYRQSASQISRSDGYLERVRAQPQLRTSYGALAARVFPGSTAWAPFLALADGAAADAGALSQDLEGAIADMSPHLRPYYRRLLRQGSTTMFTTSSS